MRAFLFYGVSKSLFVLLLLAPLWVQAQFSVMEDAVALSANCVQLTAATASQRGAAWAECPLDVSHPFSIELTVFLGNNNGGADGIAWVMQQLGPNAPTTFNGGNMGYGNYTNATGFIDPVFDPSLVVEFDTWLNGNMGDPTYDHVALQRDGTHDHTSPNCLAGAPPNSIQASATNANIEDGMDHSVLMEWTPETQLFRMEFDGAERFAVSVDLINDVFAGNSQVWWGFTGSTGAATNVQSFCLINADNPSEISDLELTPPPPYAVCPGETIDITASTPSGNVTWNASGSANLPAGPGEYILEGTINGCPQSESITVNTLPTPNLTTEANIVLCDGSAAVLTAQAEDGTDLDWDGTGQSTLTVSTGGAHEVTGLLGTCSESAVVTVDVQASPLVTVNPSPSIELCEGETVSVEATSDIPATLQWTVNNVAVNGSTIDVTSPLLAQATAVAGGCPGNTVTLDVTVLPLPTAALSAFPAELCWNNTGLVTALPNTGSSVTEWTLPIGTTAPEQAGPGLYTAHLLGANGCTSSASLTLNQLPPINWSLSAPLGECNNNAAILSVTGNHESVVWSTGDVANAIELSASDGPGPFEVEVTLGGCTETDQASIDWWPVPIIGPLPDTVIHCVLDQPEVWNWPAQSDDPIGWWVWTINDNVTTGGPAWDTEGDFTIRVFDSMTDCQDSASIVVDVWPSLDVSVIPMQSIVCWGEETEVFGELKAVEGTNLEEIPYTLTWSEPDIEGLNPTLPAGTYLVTAENACGISVDVVDITQEYCGCDMWVPTAFTPDNDGVNDGFRVETNCPELDEFLFQIFDRWGEIVWSTDDPERPWSGGSNEGTAMNGQHYIQDGVYGYRLFWRYGKLGIPVIEERTGHIHILR